MQADYVHHSLDGLENTLFLFAAGGVSLTPLPREDSRRVR